MKPERTQPPMVARDLDRPESENPTLEGWRVDDVPNAISRHFPQESFAGAVSFLTKTADAIERSGAEPWVVIDGKGVTVRLGNPPGSGVLLRERELAAAIGQVA